MFKMTKYISALTVAGLSLAACSDSIITNSEDNTISGTGEKTPLEIAVTLQDTDTGAKTRAVDGSFETGDQLIAYVQQVAASDDVIKSTTNITEKISKLVTWKLSQKAISEATKSKNQMTVTSDNSDGKLGMTIYWDDFSNSTDDIRGEKRFLRVGYGYCYNEGTPSTTLTEDTGVLGWTVQGDQSALADKKKSDLLWASATVPFIAGNYVKYEHVVTDRKPLPVTYTHAMSKVTIELVLEDESYATDNSGIAAAFNNKATTPTLYANKTASVDAIKQSITATVVSGDDAKIQMYLVQDANSTNPRTRIYEAIIAPTVMKAGNVLAEVTVDGNKYELKLTDALLTTLPEGRTGSTWAKELYSYTSSGSKVTKNSDESQAAATSPDGITKSGINYYLIAKLKKQKIEVSASIADWKPVLSSTEGLIQFSADVTNPTVSDGSTPVTNTSFDLWMSSTQTDATTVEGRPSAAAYDADGNTDGIQKASTYTYNSTTNKWEGSPVLYWPNGGQKYYFRALATTTDGTTITSVDGSQDAAQGSDLLWAQTSEHTDTGAGVNYAAGAAINPRTGDVPLTFQHAMSKISVTLKNKYTDVPTGVDASIYNDPRNPLVNLESAKISIINLYDKGTIDISTGKMVKTSLDNSSTDPYTFSSVGDANKVNVEYKWLDKIVVPQSLVTDKNDATRTTTPSFYSLANLTAIYPTSGTSIPAVGETPTYYLTTDLQKVEVKYTEAEANAYNLALPAPAAVWTTSTIKEPERLYTYDEFKTVFPTNEYQPLLETKFTELPDKAKQIDYTFNEFKELDFTIELFAAIPNELKIKTPAGQYTSVTEYNEAKGLDNSSADKTALTEELFEALPEAEKAYPAVLFQDTEISEFKTALASEETVFNSLSGDWKKKTLSLDEYKALDPVPEALFNLLPESLKTRPAVTYTEQEVNEHNATLPGAVHVGDIKTIYHRLKENEQTPQSHKIGELIGLGNKIMLYVTLADGTIYSIDLATCKVDGSDVLIKEWQGGYHYNYTITLSKEDIKFRALVKNWDDVQGSGNATLDWD